MGITNAVASLGTALTQTQLKRLLRYTQSKQVIFNFDADNAGVKATQRAITEIESLIYSGQVQLRILNLPDGKDADEFIKSQVNGLEKYQTLVNNAPLWFDWQIQQLLINKDLKQADDFEQVSQRMVMLLNRLADSNKRTYYTKYCAEILSQEDARLLPLYLKNLQTQLRKPQLEYSAKSAIKSSNSSEKTLLEEAEKTLLIIYLHYPEYRQEIFQKLEKKNLLFCLPHYRFLWQHILEIQPVINQENEYNSNHLLEQLQERILQSSHSKEKITTIITLSETQKKEDSGRFSLVIDAALIAMEKASLEKYLRYCYQKYKTFSSQEDLTNYHYYLSEYLTSKQKIMQLESQRSFSQLDIHGNRV